jgi:hypothetical protein
MRRVHPLFAGGFAVAVALVVAASWCGRSRVPVVETAVQSTVSVRITRHDALGMPSRTAAVRERARVRTIVEALGVDAFGPMTCPPDYAAAEFGLVLSGRDVYARRNVYVWDLFADAGSARAVVVSSSGCRGGPTADAAALRREMLVSDAGP